LTSTLTTPEVDARDLRALATASGSGIGRTLTERFAASGAKVDVTDAAESTLATTIDAAPGLTRTIGRPSDFAEEENLGQSEQAGASRNVSAPPREDIASALSAPQKGR
jgi:NAD(P)-dependent dehydrogenase (short-subunit alcohol dehydrogenase family)